VTGNFSLHNHNQTGCEAHPTTYVMGVGALYEGVKQPEREAGHSSPSSVHVKNAWSYTSTPSYVFMALPLVKSRLSLHGGVLC
jgi:hypothetical protein